MKFIITGDTHGRNVERIKQINPTADEAIIILGDAGFNYYLDSTDVKNKRAVNELHRYVYCVRGNHEERPEKCGALLRYDENVKGQVWMEMEFPYIRYFVDGGEYELDGHSTLVIGGAYSVDKDYRLSRFSKDAKWTGWFRDEQLHDIEWSHIFRKVRQRTYDLVLTHTCPIDWQPTDLFLRGLNQSTVDNTMEKWLALIRDEITYGIWLFGHYHDDRLVRPFVEMFYTDSDSLDDIFDRWDNFVNNGTLPWWMKKDPNFYVDYPVVCKNLKIF